MIYIPNEDVFAYNNGICTLSEYEINSVNGGLTIEELYELALEAYDKMLRQLYSPLTDLYMILFLVNFPKK